MRRVRSVPDSVFQNGDSQAHLQAKTAHLRKPSWARIWYSETLDPKILGGSQVRLALVSLDRVDEKRVGGWTIGSCCRRLADRGKLWKAMEKHPAVYHWLEPGSDRYWTGP